MDSKAFRIILLSPIFTVLSIWNFCLGTQTVGTFPEQRPFLRLKMEQWAFYPAPGQQVIVYHPDTAEPLTPFNVKLETKALGKYELDLGYRRVELPVGQEVSLIFSGPEGMKTLSVLKDGKEIGYTKMAVTAGTFFEGGIYTNLFEPLC